MTELGIVKPDETHYDETENKTHSDMLFQYSTLVMLLKGVIEFPKVPNYQSRTQKLLLLNNGLFTANVLIAMILSDTNVSRSCYRTTGPAYRVAPTGFTAV